MTEISGKSLHEIYKEDARKYKESIEKGRVYSESADSLIGNFDKTESLTVTMPMEEFDKLEKLALSAHTDKLSVEKLIEIRVEELKDFNSKILQAELKNQKLQKQLNTVKKALTEISKTKDFYRSGRDHWEEFSQDALKAQKALAAIGGDDE